MADGSYGIDALPRSPVPQTSSTPVLLVSIALGSAMGGVARYLLTVFVQDRTATAFPFGTLAVNIAGCLILGFLVQLLADRGTYSHATQALLTTGFCGGFTTFSTFSWETVRLLQEGAVSRAIAYVSVSLVAGLAALWFGMSAARFTSAP
ncbi:MAG TPA: fluoride efflux transporter CrcB [Gemmatimonadales bacterium]|nr:fluoride efflux transporter CrcB [Gemmatimonadales bacterium]